MSQCACIYNAFMAIFIDLFFGGGLTILVQNLDALILTDPLK